MRIGAAYYPEHWPQERMPVDIAMMKESGVNLVRLAEFAWTLIEPNPGEFEFGWLDDAVGALADAGIAVVMGTPTSAPPKWLVDRHPEIYPIDRKGLVRGYGHRNYYTVNAPVYWLYTDRLARTMAERYRDSANVIGWQIDNEIAGSESTWSYGEQDRRAFEEWLRRKYATIDALNHAWGTRFSNQVYRTFSEIIVPARGAIDLHNPGLELDFRRFSSDSHVAFIKRQADIIREVIPGAIITTNYVSNFHDVDYFKLADVLDVVSLGGYPNMNPAIEDRAPDQSFFHRAAYAYKGHDYWMLEHQSGAPGATYLRPAPEPGDIMRWSMQTIAHGSNVVLYFRWRTCVFGVEQYWHGILPHWGEANQRLAEVKAVCSRMATVEARAGEQPMLPQGTSACRDRAPVALMFSQDNHWIFQVQGHVRGHVYADHLRRYYRALWHGSYDVDIISDAHDLAGYRVVIAPNLAAVDEALARRIERFVEDGGTFLCDFRSGSRDRRNQMIGEAAPGLLSKTLGIRVEEYGVIYERSAQAMAPVATDGETLEGATAYEATGWMEELSLHGATAAGAYAYGRLAGAAALTRNSHGSGSAWYLSTIISDAGLEVLVARVCADAGVAPTLNVSRDVEVRRRRLGDTSLTFVINHGEETTTVELPESMADAATGVRLRSVELDPGEVRILM